MLFNNAGEWMRQDDTYTEEGFQASLHAHDLEKLCAFGISTSMS